MPVQSGWMLSTVVRMPSDSYCTGIPGCAIENQNTPSSVSYRRQVSSPSGDDSDTVDTLVVAASNAA